MGYNSSTGVMSGSISHSDLRNMLGVAYKTNRELCRAASVNPKSRYKPVEYAASTGPLGDAQFKAANWGYSIPEPVNSTVYRNYIVSGTTPSGYGYEKPYSDSIDMGRGWWYIKPTTWYRLQDFNKYNHKNKTGSLLGDVYCGVSYTSVSISYTAGVISMYEVGDLSSMHFGCAIRTPNNTIWYVTTLNSGSKTDITLGEADKKKIFTTAGTYTIYGLAVQDNSGVTNQVGAVIPLPDCEASFNVSSDIINGGGGEVTKSVYIRLGNISADWATLYVENRGSSSVTVSNLRVGVYETDGAGNPAHRSYLSGYITLTAGAGTTSSTTIDISGGYIGEDMEMGVKIESYSGAPSHWNIDYTFYIFRT